MVHTRVGITKTDGKYIIFRLGTTYLLNDAIHALSPNTSLDSSPTKVVASSHYPVNIKIQKLNRPKFVP